MTNDETPNLAELHSLVRSRTPEQRNAERTARFVEKQKIKQAATDAKNASPRAGTGIRLVGNMIESTGGTGQARAGAGIEVIIMDSNGTLVYANSDDEITGEVPES